MGASAYTRQRLEEAAHGARTLSEALTRLGVDPGSPTRRYVLDRTRKFGIDTSHFTPVIRTERMRHDQRRRTAAEILVEDTSAHAGCGVGPEWLGKPMTLEIDHVNGDWRDNRRDNLRLLRPNCHAITSNWCRGGRRPARRAQ